MKTTNLFIDFLVIGFLAAVPVLPFAISYCNVYPPDWESISEGRALVLPIGMLAIYVLGMLFNQVSGYFVELLGKLRFLPSSKKLENEAFGSLGTDYHTAVQLIVTKSTDAFAYLSYRRTVIRIYRAILSSMFFLAIAIVICQFSWPLVFDREIVTALSCLGVAIFTGVVFAKNLRGYYSAIKIFYEALS